MDAGGHTCWLLQRRDTITKHQSALHLTPQLGCWWPHLRGPGADALKVERENVLAIVRDGGGAGGASRAVEQKVWIPSGPEVSELVGGWHRHCDGFSCTATSNTISIFQGCSWAQVQEWRACSWEARGLPGAVICTWILYRSTASVGQRTGGDGEVGGIDRQRCRGRRRIDGGARTHSSCHRIRCVTGPAGGFSRGRREHDGIVTRALKRGKGAAPDAARAVVEGGVGPCCARGRRGRGAGEGGSGREEAIDEWRCCDGVAVPVLQRGAGCQQRVRWLMPRRQST